MERLLSLLISTFIITNGFAQINSDSVDSVYYRRLYNSIDSTYKLNKLNDLEIRVWTKSALTTYTTLFTLCRSENFWRARYFELTNKSNQLKWIEKPTEQIKLDSIWTRLRDNKILTLPTQDSLVKKMKIYKADSTLLASNDEDVFMKVDVTDGVVYRFEVKFENQKRIYYYHSPEAYLKHNPNIEELYRAYAIVSIIKQYLKIPLRQ